MFFILIFFIFVFGCCDSKSEFSEIYQCSDGYASQARILILSPQENYLFNHFLFEPQGRLLQRENFHLNKSSNHIVTLTGMLRGGVSHPNSETEEPLCLTTMETPKVHDLLDIINLAEEISKKSFQLMIVAVAPELGKNPLGRLETELLVSELMLIDSLYEESRRERTQFVFISDSRPDKIEEEELNQWAIDVQRSVWNISSTDLENYQVPWITNNREAGRVLSIELNKECYTWKLKKDNFFSNERISWIDPPSTISIHQEGESVNFQCLFKADKFDREGVMVQSNVTLSDEDVELTVTHDKGDLYRVNVTVYNPNANQHYWCSIRGEDAINSVKILIDGEKQGTWSDWSPWQPCETLDSTSTRNRRKDTSNTNGIPVDLEETQERPCQCSDLVKLPEPRILLLGKTGVGKSTLGNKLLGGYEVFPEGKGDDAKTEHTSYAVASFIGDQECVTIIDTPGMKNIRGKDYQHSLNMIDFLKNDVKTFNAIIVLVKGGSIDDGTIEVLKWYEAMFGFRMWEHVIIEVTFWPHTQRSFNQRLYKGKINEDRMQEKIRSKLFTELQVPRHIIVPVIFIDPMAQISEDVCEVGYSPKEEREINQFSKYIAELKETLRSAPVYNCSEDCMNPDSFFQGAPILSYPMEGILYIRPGEEKSIEWQIWTGIISSKGVTYTLKMDNATIYKNVDGSITEVDESFEASTGFSTLIDEITKVPKVTSIYMSIALNKDHVLESYNSLVVLENGIDPPSSVKILIAKDATLGQWSDWSGCSVSCVPEGSTLAGREVRTRICSPEENRGRSCSELLSDPSIANNTAGIETMTRECFGSNISTVTLCPIDATWSSWSEWGPCPVTCGQGHQVRSRACINGRNGGTLCEDKFSFDRRRCSVNQTCPLNCNLGDWSRWSSCSATCWKPDSQVPFRQRSKPILSEGNPNGISCEKLISLEREDCPVPSCPVNVELRVIDSTTSTSISDTNVTFRPLNETWRSSNGLTDVFGSYQINSIASQQFLNINATKDGYRMAEEQFFIEPTVEAKKIFFLKLTPLKCILSEWTSWSSCSNTCKKPFSVESTRMRSKSILQSGHHNGVTCDQLIKSETETCSIQFCPVDFSITIRDAKTNSSISGASVSIVYLNDSSRSYSGYTNSLGVFTIGTLQPGKPFNITVTKASYNSVVKSFEINPLSQSEQITVHMNPHDCLLGEWSQWSSCPVTCSIAGVTSQAVRRTKPILQQGHPNGITCDRLVTSETKNCIVPDCIVNVMIRILDSTSNVGISGAQVFYQLLNGTMGSSSGLTNSAGTYTIGMMPPFQALKIMATSENFNNVEKQFIIQDSEDQTLMLAMSPIPRVMEARIVMSWVSKPKDLDLHVVSVLPSSGSVQCHAYYSNKNCPEFNLDVDNTQGGENGAETITITKPEKFIYAVIVFNFSGNDHQYLLSKSGCTIDVYNGGQSQKMTVPNYYSENRYWFVGCLHWSASKSFHVKNELISDEPKTIAQRCANVF